MTIFPCPIFPLAEHSSLGPNTLKTSIWLSACVSILAVCQMAGSRFKPSCPGLHRIRESYPVGQGVPRDIRDLQDALNLSRDTSFAYTQRKTETVQKGVG